MLLRAAVEIGDLFEVAVVSILSGVGVTALFSLVVFVGGRSAEARRQGSGSAALGYSVLAFLCFLAFMTVVAVGVNIMLSKG